MCAGDRMTARGGGLAQMKRNERRVRFQDVQTSAGVREHAVRAYLTGIKD